MTRALIKHPESGALILGERLPVGTRLLDTDYYDSTTGKWAPCPCPGLVIQEGCDVIWVRKEPPQ